jgi:serine protease AprX
MKNLAHLILCVLIAFSFQDGRDHEYYKIKAAQIDYLQGEEFISRDIGGKGIRIAIFDGGFPGTNTHPALQHLQQNKQILATWNFVKNNENVYSGVSHGTAVLACIAGIVDGHQLGLAPEAEFLLALTEQNGEPLQEEENWAKAVDWAIENDVNIIQSSLGYTYHRYFSSELDGKHSIAAAAAAKAARHGILVINCNGNEGQRNWRTLVTPADADSILSVGAIDPETGLAAAFSSIGPTSDGRIKPNVCAPGKVVTLNSKGGTRIMEGTSFSAPLVTGFAACCWQLNPELSAQEIIVLIEKSSHLYPYYDYRHGYGIPQAKRIFKLEKKDKEGFLNILDNNENLIVELKKREPHPANIKMNRYLYYHFISSQGRLTKYGVYDVNDQLKITFLKSSIPRGGTFRCFFNGETKEWQEENQSPAF